MWYEAEYSVNPSEIDKTSSAVYVYVRKDITYAEREDGDGVYVCQEQKIPKKDWGVYEKILSHEVELSEVQDALIELAAIMTEG